MGIYRGHVFTCIVPFLLTVQWTANDYALPQIPEWWINNQLYGECLVAVLCPCTTTSEGIRSQLS